MSGKKGAEHYMEFAAIRGENCIGENVYIYMKLHLHKLFGRLHRRESNGVLWMGAG